MFVTSVVMFAALANFHAADLTKLDASKVKVYKPDAITWVQDGKATMPIVARPGKRRYGPRGWEYPALPEAERLARIESLRCRLGPNKIVAWHKGSQFAFLYTHSPIWKKLGDYAKDQGHGGMDFMMDARWVYCLHEGLPLDIDVYDSATWSCLAGLTEESVNRRGAAIDVPDFTRGGWEAAKPLPILDLDVSKLSLLKSSKG